MVKLTLPATITAVTTVVDCRHRSGWSLIVLILALDVHIATGAGYTADARYRQLSAILVVVCSGCEDAVGAEKQELDCRRD